MELVIVMSIVAILAAVAIPNMIDMRSDAQSAVTKDRMLAIKRAIVGDGKVVSGGTYAFSGYESDMGAPPGGLTSLVTNPNTGNSTQDYDPITRSGWRGPYMESSSISDFTKDSWGSAFVFTTSPRLIRSWGPNKANNTGGTDDIDLTY